VEASSAVSAGGPASASSSASKLVEVALSFPPHCSDGEHSPPRSSHPGLPAGLIGIGTEDAWPVEVLITLYELCKDETPSHFAATEISPLPLWPPPFSGDGALIAPESPHGEAVEVEKSLKKREQLLSLNAWSISCGV
jgi:hypothetical protein